MWKFTGNNSHTLIQSTNRVRHYVDSVYSNWNVIHITWPSWRPRRSLVRSHFLQCQMLAFQYTCPIAFHLIHIFAMLQLTKLTNLNNFFYQMKKKTHWLHSIEFLVGNPTDLAWKLTFLPGIGMDSGMVLSPPFEFRTFVERGRQRPWTEEKLMTNYVFEIRATHITPKKYLYATCNTAYVFELLICICVG